MLNYCIACDLTYPLDTNRMRCGCGGLMEVRADWKADHDTWRDRPLGVWRYREMLPHIDGMVPVTLGEGGTGLHRADRMAQWCGIDELHIKNEGENPTGSFKDRGMTVGVTMAKAMGHSVVGCASTGNTAASLAAYAARAGLTAVVVVPAGKIALGKLAQSIVHGARVLAVKGNFDQALETIGLLAEEGSLYLLNSINPLRLEGQKTLVWEVLDQLDEVPDRVVYPVGNAGNISAAHKALVERDRMGMLPRMPRLTGVQAEGAAPFARMMASGADTLTSEPRPETVATAIRIGHPVSWPKARAAVMETGGTVTTVTDEEILAAQRALASLEGIFVEPASAASLAGLRKLVHVREVDARERVVCITTGNGLKDPDAVLRTSEGAVIEVEPDPRHVRATLEAWS
ncbi:MAG: threonine synthase [Euryarchaeota archaeon]|nr:threonine synthase [Euryarchaeota archaeon]